MRAIQKKIVTDEAMKPIAIQIDYADWLEIERLIKTGQEPRLLDPSKYLGILTLSEEPLEYQLRMREEWP
jgi:hypothetical protein